MYATHATYIQDAVKLAGPALLGDVVRFTLATIRKPLWQAAQDSRALLTGEGDVPKAARGILWGSKRAGFDYLETPRGLETLQRATYTVGRTETLLALAEIPGLGLVKAGFVCQQAFGFGGCIDTHNLKLYGIPTADVTLGSVKLEGEAAHRKASAYLGLCDRLGGPETLWDAWCEFVAETQPARYESAHAVSFAHLYGLGLAG